MKILYVDFYCNCWGHKRMNMGFLQCLVSFAEVDALFQRGWYKNVPDGVSLYELPDETYRTGRISARVNSLRIMKAASKLDRKNKYDYIFVSSYETVAFGIGMNFFSLTDRLYILHHNNLDGIIRSSVKQYFRFYAKKVNHFVFEDFIGEFLYQQYGVARDKIHILPHPMYNNHANCKKTYDCVGISNSNDDKLVKELIEKEKCEGIFKKAGKHVILRAHNEIFNDGNLQVLSGYLDVEKYNDYINRAKAILILFPKNFNYRASGTLIDALSNSNKLYGTDISLMEEYHEKYPSVCKIFHDTDELINLILTEEDEYVEEEFQHFAEVHSPLGIIKALKSAFNE